MQINWLRQLNGNDGFYEIFPDLYYRFTLKGGGGGGGAKLRRKWPVRYNGRCGKENIVIKLPKSIKSSNLPSQQT